METGVITIDLLVIGGGINGAGIARDAAGRGLRVLLCEKDDLAGHTSSASTKLIHGGLRYLEQGDFRLVRHALAEREVLWRMAPHIVQPLRFVLPHRRGMRPRWLIRAGLFLYDHLGGRRLLPPSRRVDLRRHPAGRALKPEFRTGFEYSDCQVQDARLVVLNAMDAAARGAAIHTRTRCVALNRHSDHWLADLRRGEDGDGFQVRARAVVNASGPWVEQVLGLLNGPRTGRHLRLVKGSHIVVPRLFDHPYPYIFQHDDGRVLFAIPFEDAFTLLGTTDQELEEVPEHPTVDAAETDYICAVVNRYLARPVAPSDVIWGFSGVRPLYDDAAGSASRVTRDYRLDLDIDGPPLLTVWGGKITTYRELAERAMGLLAEPLGVIAGDWTAASTLPGGDFEVTGFDRLVQGCADRYPWLPLDLLQGYCRRYGTRIHRLLDGCAGRGDLGRHFGAGLHEREVRYLLEHEFAGTAEDILWRRTWLGLRLSPGQRQALAAWLGSEGASLPAGSA